MRLLLALLAVALVSGGVDACGGTGKVVSSTSRALSSVAASSRIGTTGNASSTIPELPPPERATEHYLNDGDHDHIGDPDSDNKSDTDEDPYYDYQPDDNGRYHDSDDAGILAFGHAAGTAEVQAVTAVTKRYYAAAAAGEGYRACAMLPPGFVKVIPLDYGQFGPSYLRGARTCEAVMARLFKRAHHDLRAPVAVSGVRVEGDNAYGLLGSAKMPAGYVTLQREHGEWRIDELLGDPLP